MASSSLAQIKLLADHRQDKSILKNRFYVFIFGCLTVVASLVAEHGLASARASAVAAGSRELQVLGS